MSSVDKLHLLMNCSSFRYNNKHCVFARVSKIRSKKSFKVE